MRADSGCDYRRGFDTKLWLGLASLLAGAVLCVAGCGGSQGSDRADATSPDVAEGDALQTECPGVECGIAFRIVNLGLVTQYVDPERPLDFFIEEDGQWVKFRPNHGCVSVCQPCEAFWCSGCYDMTGIPSGEDYQFSWHGRIYGRDGFHQCESTEAGEIDCFNEEVAPAGRYKVVLRHSWKWNPGTCMDDNYPSLSEPSEITVELDYPVPDSAPVPLTIPEDTTQLPR